ncbi:MAG TPA: hypothetical protein VJT09_19375 [Pyrinomonadaceae bacterium]|nr:hypothetical protein [Pyrinomonadaceae bacterium]
MVAKKTSTRAAAQTASTGEPSKAELQRRMEEAREDISQTVEEIKETVTEQYETVKETVAETLDWRAQFRKHSVAWSLGALAVGYVVGSGIAAAMEDATPKKRGRKPSGLLEEVYAIGERLSDEFSGVAQTILLPALSKKIRDKFGIDLSDRLQTVWAAKSATSSTKRASKKGGAKKSAAKKSAAKKSAAKKSATTKHAAKKKGG